MAAATYLVDTMTKEKPILFSAPMVRAILAGRKTVTRRIVKPQPSEIDGVLQAGNAALLAAIFGRTPTSDDVEAMKPRCPYGAPGDRLWVKETFARGRAYVIYRADCVDDRPSANTDDWNEVDPDRWRAAIHLPRVYSRITLEVVSVRAERVQDITEADCAAEGIETHFQGQPISGLRHEFAALWDSINGEGSWASNPWVWRIEFRRIK